MCGGREEDARRDGGGDPIADGVVDGCYDAAEEARRFLGFLREFGVSEVVVSGGGGGAVASVLSPGRAARLQATCDDTSQSAKAMERRSNRMAASERSQWEPRSGMRPMMAAMVIRSQARAV